MVEFVAVGSLGPRGVEVGDPQIAFSASICQVGSESEHQIRDDLVGVVPIVSVAPGLGHRAPRYEVHVTLFLVFARTNDGPQHR